MTASTELPRESAADDFLPRGERIGERTARGTGLSLVAQVLRIGLTIASTAVLGRLLTPADFGVVGMALAFINLVESFRDAGLGLATIHQPRLSHAQISTLFWINLVLSMALSSLMIAASPLVVHFYADDRVGPVIVALSLLFIPAGASVQHRATLGRQLKFGWIAALEIATQFATSLTAIVMALAGYGYWSLVGGSAAGAVTALVVAWQGSPWLPGRPQRGTGIRKMLEFGGYTAASGLLYMLAKDLDKILLGRFWGPAAVGFYSRANQLTMLPTTTFSGAIGRSLVPGLAASTHHPEEFRRLYIHNTSLLALLAMPMAALALVAADHFVPLLLGNQWAEAIPVFRALAVAALAHPIASTNGWLYWAYGRGLANFAWIAGNVPLMVLSVAIGIPWGALGVAVSYSAYLALTVIPCMLFAMRGTPLRLRDLWPILRTPVVLSLAVAAGAAVPFWTGASLSPLAGSIACTLLGGMAAMGALMSLPVVRQDAIESLRALGIARWVERPRAA